jgi:hypothetical protein
MGYLAVWKIQEEIVTDFRKKGKTIPEKTMNDLKSARTLIKMLKTDTSQEDTLQKIETYLTNVESYLVSEGERLFGTEYVDEWLKRLNEASKKKAEPDEEETRFVPGLPRGQKWVRVKPSAELPIEKVKTFAEKSGLLYKMQNDGNLLVYGKDEQVKSFVKKMATEHGLKAKK